MNTYDYPLESLRGIIMLHFRAISRPFCSRWAIKEFLQILLEDV